MLACMCALEEAIIQRKCANLKGWFQFSEDGVPQNNPLKKYEVVISLMNTSEEQDISFFLSLTEWNFHPEEHLHVIT